MHSSRSRASRRSPQTESSYGTSSRPVQHVLRLRCIADSRGRHRRARGGPEHRLVPSRRRRPHGKNAVQGRSSWRDLRLFDSERVPAEEWSEADPRSREFSALGVLDRGWPPRLVGARSGVRDEIGAQHRGRRGLRERMGIPAEPGRLAGADGAIRGRPREIRHEQRWPHRDNGDYGRRADGQDAQLEGRLSSLRPRWRRFARCEGVGGLPRDARVRRTGCWRLGSAVRGR